MSKNNQVCKMKKTKLIVSFRKIFKNVLDWVENIFIQIFSVKNSGIKFVFIRFLWDFLWEIELLRLKKLRNKHFGGVVGANCRIISKQLNAFFYLDVRHFLIKYTVYYTPSTIVDTLVLCKSCSTEVKPPVFWKGISLLVILDTRELNSEVPSKSVFLS